MNNHATYEYQLRWAKKIRVIQLLGGKCVKCGCIDYHLLTFDHMHNKECCINDIKLARWSVIQQEINKCQLLCMRCHKEHHEIKHSQCRKNKEVMLTFKGVFKCQLCGYNKCTRALDFHHDNKDKLFTMASKSKSKTWKTVADLEDSIVDELQKCIVLCANCHCDVHFDHERFDHNIDIIMYKVKHYKECPPKIDRESVISMIHNGMRQVDIVNRLKVAKSTISKICAMH